MGTIANAKVTHYYNCYNGDFIGCLLPTGWEWMIIKIGCIVQNTAYFLKIKIYFFLLVFFFAFA